MRMTEATDAQTAETPAKTAGIALPRFQILGGPLHRLGKWLGLVNRDDNTVGLGLFLGWFPWLALLVLAGAQGYAAHIMSLAMAAGHVRLLFVIPLLFLCESEAARKMREFVAMIASAGLAPPQALPGLEREIVSIRRLADSWIPDATAILGAVLLTLLANHGHIVGRTASIDPLRWRGDMPLAGIWYWFFCLPLFRFLIFRFLWTLAFWWRFLWRLSKSELHLVPTHPDGAGGLGYLEVVQKRFALLALAISALTAAAFAEEIALGLSMFEIIYPEMAITVLLDLALILAPPCVFIFRLRDCQEQGLRDYMTLASRYVGDFERKWLGAPRDAPEPLLGTADLQSLADLGNSVNVIRNMRYAPISTRLATTALAAAMIPMLPLFLFKYPIAEIIRKLLMKLTGL